MLTCAVADKLELPLKVRVPVGSILANMAPHAAAAPLSEQFVEPDPAIVRGSEKVVVMADASLTIKLAPDATWIDAPAENGSTRTRGLWIGA